MSVKSQHKITHQQADGAVYLPFEKVYTAKVGGTLNFPIEPQTLIYGLVVRCVTTVSGGTPAVTVGDGTTADLWVAAAAAIETAGNVVSSLATVDAKYFAAADKIAVVLGSGVTAGELEIRVLMSGKEAAPTASQKYTPPAGML